VFAFGSIVLTRFPFTDLSGEKRRPALVVWRDNQRRTDLVVCFITSVPRTGPDTAIIAPGPPAGLKVPSVVRFDKLAKLDPKVVAGKLSDASAAWLDVHRDIFYGVFGFKLP